MFQTLANHLERLQKLGPPARYPIFKPFFGWEGSPTEIDYRKKLVPTYSNLSTEGPSKQRPHGIVFEPLPYTISVDPQTSFRFTPPIPTRSQTPSARPSNRVIATRHARHAHVLLAAAQLGRVHGHEQGLHPGLLQLGDLRDLRPQARRNSTKKAGKCASQRGGRKNP